MTPAFRRGGLLAMIAHALLVVIAANEHTDRPTPDGLIRAEGHFRCL
jgi:hypothetical protein